MLSDEEKAIEMIEHIQECNTLIGYGVEDRTILAKALLNLIEKQSKEIEELKEKNKDLDEQNFKYTIKIASLQTDIQETTKLINKNWKDKIKAKIEELDEEIKVKREIAKNPMDRVSGRLLTDSIVELEKTKKVLQSLLEKE